LLAAAQAQSPAAGPGEEILAGSGTLGSGIAIQYNSLAVGPVGLADSIGGGFRIDGDKLYRILIDKATRQYLGYQLGVAAGPSAGAYLVSIDPVTGVEDLLRRFSSDAVLKPAPAPKCPAPQVMREGDAIALDLMASLDGRRRITDTIRLLPEVTTRETPIAFKSAVNLVSVPVVVRDGQGRAVGNLSQGDFQIADSGKPRTVARFSVEKSGAGAPAPNLPDRFVTYLFDDLHLGYPDDSSYQGGIQDMERARDAAWRHIAASLRPNERAALYTTSGLAGVDFTADRERLHKALLAVRALGAARKDSKTMSFWLADQIENKGNPHLLVAGADARSMVAIRRPGDAGVSFGAATALEYWNRDTHAALDALDHAIGKLSTMPGQRSLVLVSPGFLVLADSVEWETRIVDRAIRAGVVVSAVDVKGVSSRLDRDIANDERAVMVELTAGTGGRFIENSNDLDQAFRLVSGSPETMYVLGFIPQDLKLDGRYHPLKVTLRNSRGLTVEARHGYYAPRYADSPAEQAKKQIEETFFSAEEIRGLPVTVETQFFKSGSDEATVDVLAKVDVKQLQFQKENGRNRNDVTVVTGLFDRDGNYLLGTRKTLELRLKDETLATRLAAGIAVRTSFDVKPGSYSVRTVVRDSEGQSLAALSAALEIP
jgi:VWFA-related protein